MIFHKKIRKGGKEKMQELKNYLQDEEGMGTVEVILIIVVLVGLVLIFKKQITTIINDLFDSIVTKSAEVAK